MTAAPEPEKGIWGEVLRGDLGYIDVAFRELHDRIAALETAVARLEAERAK